MKRAIKITLLSLLTLIVITITGVVIAGYQLLTPSRLTSWAKSYAQDYISCPTEIGEVELTVLSTFPDIAIHLKDVSLVNPVEGAQSDTLLYVHDLFASIDVMAFLEEDRIDVKGFTLQHGRINMFISPDSISNFDVYISEPDTIETTDETTFALSKVDLQDIKIEDFSVTFLDMRHLLEARVIGLDLDLATDVEIESLSGDIDLTMKTDEIFYSDANNFAHVEGMHFENCCIWSDGANASLKLERFDATDQEYMLSGETSLLAHMWNLVLTDIDLKWDTPSTIAAGRPTGSVLTQLDSASVTVGAEDFMYVTLGKSLVDVPVTSNDSVWTATAKTVIKHLTVSDDIDGMLIDNLDLDTRFVATTDTAFRDFHVNKMRTTLGTQTVEGSVHANIVDSTLMKVNLALSLHDTRLSELLAIVPAAYMPDLAGAEVEADLQNSRMSVLAEMRDDLFNITSLTLKGNAPQLRYAEADTLVARFTNATLDLTLPKGTLYRRMPIRIASTATGADIEVSGIALNAGAVAFNTQLIYDDRKKELLDQFDPVLNLKAKKGVVTTPDFPMPVILPAASLSFCKDSMQLDNTDVEIGNSKMTFTGTLRNINDWLQDKAQLEGRFKMKSQLVDADELMQVVSGMGVTDSAAVAADTVNAADADPFMVPMGVDVALDSHIDRIVFSGNDFNQVAGKISVNEGVLVLEEMGFTSKAARMQLTALYKSPRRNNLFVGWNFHLLDIDIAEMINLVPEIDTIAPMVKAFAGKAEFHLAGETALFADYSPKMSTLKAAAAIEGQNLTVLDNETFQTIKKYLFKESTTNKIDSMSVELAIARKKMTLYPMLVTWDKYQAVISGTHTIVDEMPFNYHISITKCPVVGGHLGLDIVGDLDDLDNITYKIGSCRYANLYRPEKRNITQEQTLALKQLISSSLKKTVK